jgi:endogenous inhibitor of DNA gyrase (YacG/DUF329 family)
MPEYPKPEKVELCVFCRRQAAERAWRPFCSERCKMQDLARWADESYRVHGDPLENDEPDEPAIDAPEKVSLRKTPKR